MSARKLPALIGPAPLVLLASLTALAVPVTPALAQPVADAARAPEADVAPLLAGLDSEDWRLRVDTTERLMNDEAIPLPLLAALEAPAESPEALARVDVAIQHRLLMQICRAHGRPGDPGSLGIRHQDVGNAELVPGRVAGDRNPAQRLRAANTTPAIMVVDVLPGFPAAGRLRPGDLITRFNGLPVPDQGRDAERFSAMIKQKRLGDRVRLDVRRDGRPVQIELDLASSTALEQMYTQGARNPFGTGGRLRPALDAVRAALRATPEEDPFRDHPELLEPAAAPAPAVLPRRPPGLPLPLPLPIPQP